MKFWVLSSCTGSQEPIQKTQQCSTAKQRFVKKGVQWLFPLCTGTPGHNQILNGIDAVVSLGKYWQIKSKPTQVCRQLNALSRVVYGLAE